MSRLSVFFAVFVLVATQVSAATITVRQDGTGDYLTIGDAIAAAGAGDAIEVGPGTYNETLSVNKSLTIYSVMGPAMTILDGGGTSRIMDVSSSTVSIEGLRFQNGYSSSGGGGMQIASSVVQVTDCEYENNYATFDGGAFYASAGSYATFTGCAFRNNRTEHNGGAGNGVQGSTLNIEDCYFESNSTDVFSAALASHEGAMDVTGSTFTGNRSGDVAGAIYYYNSLGLVANNTFYNNSAPGGVAGTVVIHRSAATTVTTNIIAGETDGAGLRYYGGGGNHSCNVFWDNADGAIVGGSLNPDDVVADPMFCGSAMNNFMISSMSPAAPMNSACGLLIGAHDIGCGAVAVEQRSWGHIKDMYKGQKE